MASVSEPSVINLKQAGELLRAGNLVAFPTETVYGLGANALSKEAVRGIFEAKGRPSDNPLIVHVDSVETAKSLVKESCFDPISLKLADVFWPGPLTIVLPVKEGLIAPNVTAGLGTVGIRVPEHPVALALLREAKVPLAAPSCNKSGSPSPTTAAHVVSDFADSAIGPSMIIDGGPCRVGLESTVVSVDSNTGYIHILRPGEVTPELISEKLNIDSSNIIKSFTVSDVEVPRAPGMKYKHYSPKAEVIAVTDWTADLSCGEGDIVLVFDPNCAACNGAVRWSLGQSTSDVETASNRLFDLFRKADQMGAKRVLVDCSFDIHSGLGMALWNRISKAASHR
jgi:L-threonylcarbamoyladenylate synthase